MAAITVSGNKVASIMLYDLSTCVWCNKTKRLLDDLGVEYSYEDVDLLSGKEREQAVKKVLKWNPLCSFPTMVINDETGIIGYKEEEIKKALGL
jgi:glutaredoxin